MNGKQKICLWIGIAVIPYCPFPKIDLVICLKHMSDYIYPIDTKGIERKWRYARQSVKSIQTFFILLFLR
jgi:hypothetical protein